MSEKSKKEELQTRRQFFKSAAKAALPILGAAIISATPLKHLLHNPIRQAAIGVVVEAAAVIVEEHVLLVVKTPVAVPVKDAADVADLAHTAVQQCVAVDVAAEMYTSQD